MRSSEGIHGRLAAAAAHQPPQARGIPGRGPEAPELSQSALSPRQVSRRAALLYRAHGWHHDRHLTGHRRRGGADPVADAAHVLGAGQLRARAGDMVAGERDDAAAALAPSRQERLAASPRQSAQPPDLDWPPLSAGAAPVRTVRLRRDRSADRAHQRTDQRAHRRSGRPRGEWCARTLRTRAAGWVAASGAVGDRRRAPLFARLQWHGVGLGAICARHPRNQRR